MYAVERPVQSDLYQLLHRESLKDPIELAFQHFDKQELCASYSTHCLWNVSYHDSGSGHMKSCLSYVIVTAIKYKCSTVFWLFLFLLFEVVFAARPITHSRRSASIKYPGAHLGSIGGHTP